MGVRDLQALVARSLRTSTESPATGPRGCHGVVTCRSDVRRCPRAGGRVRLPPPAAELAEGDEAIGEALRDVIEPTPLLDLGIFVVALAGFAAFYGLERPARWRAGPRADEREPTGVYWLHLGSFMVYNGLITYTMALRLRTGVAFAVLFAVAMALHFVLTDGPSRSTTRDDSPVADGPCWRSPS